VTSTEPSRYGHDMNSAVVLAGGWAHPGRDLIAAMTELLGSHGFNVVAVTEPGNVLEAITASCDLLVNGACWFGMTEDRYSEDQRVENAVKLDAVTAAALDQLRTNGVPLLAMHTAVICFDGWRPWRQWLGGTWDWNTSWHPEPADLTISPTVNASLAFDEFVVRDELYRDLIVDDDVHQIAQSGGHPLIWLHETSLGKCAVNLLGHDRRSLDVPAHRALNARLLDWLVG